MAMLEKGKKESDDKKDDKKKKHKHPAPKAEAAPSPQPEDSEGADEGADAGQQDDSDSDQGEAQGQGGSAGAVGEAPQGPQDQSGQGDQSGAGDDTDSGGGPQAAQQGGAQGPTPVPSPAAPGAGDTTSGGDDTPDSGQDQDPNAQPPETPGEDTAAGPGSNSDLQQVPMPPGLKEAYQEANNLLMQLLYKSGDDKLAQGLVQGLMPQGPGKIKNAIMLAVQVIVQMHKRLNIPAPIMLPFAKDVTAHVLDLGQQVKQIQYSDQECTAILGGVYEACLRIFGVNHGNVKHIAAHLGKSTLQAHQAKYLAATAHAKPAIDAANSQFHHPQLATGAQGAPTQPGPQSGAPAGAAPSAPQQGAPPTPPVPPGPPSQGGMLSQAAAAQSPQGAQ